MPEANVVAPMPKRRRRFGWLRRRADDLGPPPKFWQTHRWPRGRPNRAFIVHGKCADGFTSAGLLLHKWPDGMVLYAQPAELVTRLAHAVHSPPRLELVLADVSPQTQDADELLKLLRQIRKSCKITWLDHHAPQWSPEFEAGLRKAGVNVVLDRTRTESGASLVAKWTQTQDPALLHVADMIRRRDAWVDPHNPEARAWVAVAGARRREYVERLADVDLDGLADEGTALVNQKDLRIDAILRGIRRHSPEVRWQWRYDDINDVADRLFQSDDEAIVLLRFGNTGNVSIRTRDDAPVAADIAQAYGGGGHAHAAGFNLKLPILQRLAYRLLRGRGAAGRTVRRLAHEQAVRSRSTQKGVATPDRSLGPPSSL